MGVIGVILLVVFVIVCFLLVGMVLLQNEEGDGLGGLLGGGSSTAFGTRSGNILTKTTFVLVTLFFVASFFLALLNKGTLVAPPVQTTPQTQTEAGGQWWQDGGQAGAGTMGATVTGDEAMGDAMPDAAGAAGLPLTEAVPVEAAPVQAAPDQAQAAPAE